MYLNVLEFLISRAQFMQKSLLFFQECGGLILNWRIETSSVELRKLSHKVAACQGHVSGHRSGNSAESLQGKGKDPEATKISCHWQQVPEPYEGFAPSPLQIAATDPPLHITCGLLKQGRENQLFLKRLYGSHAVFARSPAAPSSA